MFKPHHADLGDCFGERFAGGEGVALGQHLVPCSDPGRKPNTVSEARRSVAKCYYGVKSIA